MKKFITFAVCAATMVSASAQIQAVKDAKKLSGKLDKIEEARTLIKGAMSNPETANDAFTYFVAGNIEWDAYDKAKSLAMINPEDPNVDQVAMLDQLLNGYNYYMKALPLDSVPNEKGQVKPKYSKDIAGKIASHVNEFYTVGATAFNNKKYYPEAYTAFLVYASASEMPIFGKSAPVIDQANIATSYFNAGLAAYSGNQVELAADAFRNARLNNYDQDDCYIYELACWQNLAQRDPSLEAEAQKHIYEIAVAGNEKFGAEKPIFLNNLVNCLVTDNKIDEALAMVNDQIQANPNAAGYYALRAYVKNRKGDEKGAEADYRSAASMQNADFETLKNSARFMLKKGQEMWNGIEGTGADADAQRKNVRDNYWNWANDVANKAASMNPNDADLNSILDSLEYLLSL